ncbi:MAG: hypothetical protein JWQ53_2949 [Klenkia sp.]|nr:hypothetical protein [Klenkia sp.]
MRSGAPDSTTRPATWPIGLRTAVVVAVGGLVLTACGADPAPAPAAADTSEEVRSVTHALGTTEVVGTPESLDTVTSDAGATESAAITSGGLWTWLPPVQAGGDHEIDDSRWFLGLGPSGADPVLDDLAEITASR